MKSNSYILTLLLLICFSALSQVKVAKVDLYKTSQDFFEDKLWDVYASVIIKEEGEKYLIIENFILPKTREVFKEGISAWAIEHKGEKYFNMAYHVSSRWRVYVKFDIIGKYSAIIIDENSHNKVGVDFNPYYGGGLQGLLFESLAKNARGKNNQDGNGVRKEIYIIDSKQVYPKNGYKFKSCKARFLDEKELKRLYRKRHPDKKLKNKERKLMTFDDVVNLIYELNQK